jgi:hypothetical protein
MIQEKQKTLVFKIVIYIFITAIILNCRRKDDTIKSNSIHILQEWKTGKILFLDNCSHCHIPVDREKIFFRYIRKNQSKSKFEKALFLKKVLFNKDHLSLHKQLNYDTLSLDKIHALQIYIENSDKYEIVN